MNKIFDNIKKSQASYVLRLFKSYVSARYFLVFSLFVSSVQAASPVWKVTKDTHIGEQVVYIAGTIHLLGEEDYPLPAGYETAYKQADILAFEIDLRETLTPSFQQRFLMQMRYPYGETLKQHLKASTYLNLKRHLRKRGSNINNFENFRVGFVSMNLTLLELKRLGMAGTGVDQFYTEKATADRKPIVSLETTDEHFAYLAKIGQGEEDAYIKYSLNEIKELPEILEKTKRHWRNGDLAGFEKDLMQPMKDEFPGVYHSLLVERNHNWLPQIERMFRTSQTELVMVGNLHLVGEDGLFTLLKARGYHIQQLP